MAALGNMAFVINVLLMSEVARMSTVSSSLKCSKYETFRVSVHDTYSLFAFVGCIHTRRHANAIDEGMNKCMNQIPCRVASVMFECMQLREEKPGIGRHFDD